MTRKYTKRGALPLFAAIAVIGACLTGGPAHASETEAPRCAPAQLDGQITLRGAAVGNRYALLQVTNNGATCTLYGYSGLQLQTADGTVLPTNANQREVTEGIPAEPSVVTLQPSGSAVAYLHWIVGPCFTLGDDGTPATRPAAVTVTLPDETTGFTVPWTHGAVCGDSEGRNLIDIGPYRAA